MVDALFVRTTQNPGPDTIPTATSLARSSSGP
jgi:hypothetical protein